MINADALERTAAAIAGMVGDARQHGVLAIAAVGTAGLRIAANADEVIAAIRARTGVKVEVVSGEDESRLAYLAAKSGLGTFTGSLVVFDTGGGSSQFSFGHDSIVDERFSVDVGAVRFTERYKLDGRRRRPTPCARRWRRCRPTCRVSTDERCPTPWWRWAAW